MRILALDIGARRTGIAFVDTENGIPLPLDTIDVEFEEEMIEYVKKILIDRAVDEIVIGLPLLPSGVEGEQVEFVRRCGEDLKSANIPIVFLDERYTTSSSSESDGDARAACELLRMRLQRL